MADVAKLPTTTEIPVEKSLKKEVCEENIPPTKDFRTSESHGHSTNSHHHDSEYDTASDLEGAEDDDYEDDEDDESIGLDGEDEDAESENGSIVFDLERQRGDGQEQADYTKKVDEDRSNPQYIPKKGTFYEHDDRTADDPESCENKVEDNVENEATKSATPTISTSSKTMKKWQPASAVDRWSHDRYDENEQAPKSRAELVSAYGYDIRNEDGPPRARRRRRYGRGPSKYMRNWEDESAYVKNSNAACQRKPRPEDFPALGDNEKKINKKTRSFRDEKENRIDRHGERSSNNRGGGNSNLREGRIERTNSGKGFRAGRHGMDFKNQNRKRLTNENSSNRISTNRQTERDEIRQVNDDVKVQVETVSFTNTKINPQNERYNGHDNLQINQLPNRDIKEKVSNINTNVIMNRQPQQSSQIASRLQVQSRHEPNQVNNIQMQAILPQNQTNDIQQQGSETNRTKRYSSLRQRVPNDVGISQAPQHDQHSLQQMQLHEQQHQPQQQQHVLLQDQHILQANLMQLYHPQENIQAQMQSVSIQGLSSGHQPKPQYQNVNVQQQYQTGGNAPGYYASTNEYNTGSAPPPTPAQYTQPQAAAYIQPQPAPPPQIAYNTPSQPSVPPPPQQLPGAMNYVQTPQAPTAGPPYQSFPTYQNYNTVGGTTYFVPQQQPTPRPVVLPQRRPTNAIPILAPPSDKSKPKNEKEDDIKSSNSMSSANAPIGSAENIDHILDNMFVQRPPYQPPARKSSSPSTESIGTSTNIANEDKTSTPSQIISSVTKSCDESRIEEAVKNLSLADESKNSPLTEHQQASQTQLTLGACLSQQLEITHNETG